MTVTAITKEQARNIAVVYAEDVHTKEVLRCDVIVDVIDSLLVVSRTRELYMEEAPVAFEVRAFDSRGKKYFTNFSLLSAFFFFLSSFTFKQ